MHSKPKNKTTFVVYIHVYDAVNGRIHGYPVAKVKSSL